METLDLSFHDVEEFPGKILIINGVQYLMGELLGEGAEAYVYPIKNLSSNLIQFVAKVYRFLPGSEEYQQKLQVAPRLSAKLALEEVPVERCEYYEAHGALIGFAERYAASADWKDSGVIRPIVVENPEYLPEVMQFAGQHMEAKEYSAALQRYDEVLASNPRHTDAMLKKAICLSELSQPIKASGLLFQALEIEPNDTALYREAARQQAMLGRFESAIAILRNTLDRWRLDLESWKMLMEMAIDLDFVEVARRELDAMSPVAPGSALIRKFEIELGKSAARHEKYLHLLRQAVECQMEKRWQEAFSKCEEAIQTSLNNHLAKLNWHVCHYHLGLTDNTGDQCSALMYGVGEGLRDTVALAGLLLYCRSQDWAGATRNALFINDLISNPMDLPLIPVAVASEGQVYAVRQVADIIGALQQIRERPISSDERDSLEMLLGKYATCSELLRDND